MRTYTRILAIGIVLCATACQSGSRHASVNGGDSAALIVTIDTSACDGKPVEVEETQWSNGMIKTRRHIVVTDDGRRVSHGLHTFFHEEGGKKLEIAYLCGSKHGVRDGWYPDGTVRAKGAYANGKDHGRWTLYWGSGEKQQEYTMNQGMWQGTHSRWHPNGTEAMKVHYVDGLRQGWLLSWDSDGNLVRQVEFADGKIQPTPAP